MHDMEKRKGEVSEILCGNFLGLKMSMQKLAASAPLKCLRAHKAPLYKCQCAAVYLPHEQSRCTNSGNFVLSMHKHTQFYPVRKLEKHRALQSRLAY